MSTPDELLVELRNLIALGMADDDLDAHIVAETKPTMAKAKRAALITAAHDAMRENADTPLRSTLTVSIQRLDDLYSRALHIQDFKACMAIDKQRIEVSKQIDRLNRKKPREET